MACLDKLASFLFYAMIVDFSLEMLDFIHRLYESEESIGILGKLITRKLFMSLFVIQILIGMFMPAGGHRGREAVPLPDGAAPHAVLHCVRS